MFWFAFGSITFVIAVSVLAGLFVPQKKGPRKLGALGHATNPRTGILTGGTPENWG